MRKQLFSALLIGVMIAVSGSAIATGVSDTSSEAMHCYLFFDGNDGEHYAQVMMNDDQQSVVEDEVLVALIKYILDEGMELKEHTGNLVDFGFPVPGYESLCAAVEPEQCVVCEINDEACLCSLEPGDPQYSLVQEFGLCE